MAKEYEIKSLGDQKRRIISIEGKVYFENEKEFVGEIEKMWNKFSSTTEEIYLDMRKTTYLNSSGISEIVRLHNKHFEKYRSPLTLVANQWLKSKMKLSKLDKVINVVESI